MKTQAYKRIGQTVSSVFYDIGNSLNTSIIFEPHKLDKFTPVVSDWKALEQDWHSVGREVEIAIGKFRQTCTNGHESRGTLDKARW